LGDFYSEGATLYLEDYKCKVHLIAFHASSCCTYPAVVYLHRVRAEEEEEEEEKEGRKSRVDGALVVGVIHDTVSGAGA